MLRTFDPASGKLVACTSVPESGWTHVDARTRREVAALGQDLPEELVRHALDIDEIARVDRVDDSLLLVVRCPLSVPEDRDQPFRAAAIGFIVHRGRVFTVSAAPVPLLEDFAASEGAKDEDPIRFFLAFVIFVGERFLACVRKIDDKVDALESRLDRSLGNTEVFALLRYQKALVHFKTALASNKLMLDRLSDDDRFELGDEQRDHLADARVEIEQALQTTGVSTDILGNLTDAFASIISNNLNVAMKVLTSITIIMAIPSVVGALYGMNVPLPGQDHPHTFAFLCAGIGVLAFFVAAFFRSKRWL